jgi:hypothetical protein
MAVSMFRCGRCGRRYANPLTHTCITRAGSRRKPRRTRIAPQASLTCGTCGKPYANPVTHVCTVRTDFRSRKAAAARARKRARTAQDRARKRAAAKAKAAQARQRQRAAVTSAVERERAKRREAVRNAVTRERQRAATRAARRPSGDRPRPRPAPDNHDYRECFYDTQPDRRHAAQICDRFPCRVYREGHEHVLNGAKDSYGFGVFAAFIVPMGDGGEVAWSAAAPCR